MYPQCGWQGIEGSCFLSLCKFSKPQASTDIKQSGRKINKQIHVEMGDNKGKEDLVFAPLCLFQSFFQGGKDEMLILYSSPFNLCSWILNVTISSLPSILPSIPYPLTNQDRNTNQICLSSFLVTIVPLPHHSVPTFFIRICFSYRALPIVSSNVCTVSSSFQYIFPPLHHFPPPRSHHLLKSDFPLD